MDSGDSTARTPPLAATSSAAEYAAAVSSPLPHADDERSPGATPRVVAETVLCALPTLSHGAPTASVRVPPAAESMARLDETPPALASESAWRRRNGDDDEASLPCRMRVSDTHAGLDLPGDVLLDADGDSCNGSHARSRGGTER